jgi:cell division protein FtsW (lipid II flippase)
MRSARGRTKAHRRLLLFFFLQNYLGPALVRACLCPALYGLARAQAALVAGGVLVPAAGFAAGYAPGIPATVAQRVAMWLDPWENALGA